MATINFVWGNVNTFLYDQKYGESSVNFYLSSNVEQPTRIFRETNIPGSNNRITLDTGKYSDVKFDMTATVRKLGSLTADHIVQNIVEEFTSSPSGYLKFYDGDNYMVDARNYFLAKLDSISVKRDSVDCSFYKIFVKMTRRPEVFDQNVLPTNIGTSFTMIKNKTLYDATAEIRGTYGAGNVVNLTLVNSNGDVSQLKLPTYGSEDKKFVFDTEDLSLKVRLTTSGEFERVYPVQISGDWILTPGTNEIEMSEANDASAVIRPRWWTPWFF